MSKNLVIVESPAKARTLEKFLGKDFSVLASYGHVRDLPSSAAEIPAKFKSEKWARLGVDVDNGYAPLYVVHADKKARIRELKAKLKDASTLYLATDEDREGESISWHLLDLLRPTVPVKRMVFHEITKAAIQEALGNCRDVDMHLVDAQESRRILDRLYGYEVSPVLWRKIAPRLSAGRVQSVATRLIVERERERMAFRSASWWDSQVTLEYEAQRFPAQVVSLDGTALAIGRDFSPDGKLAPGRTVLVLDEAAAKKLAAGISGRTARVRKVEEKEYSSSPKPPVHDLDPAAGGRAQARNDSQRRHAGRAAVVRERSDHLHAHGQRHALDAGRVGRARAGGRALRRGVPAEEPAPLGGQVPQRAGGARGDPAGRRDVPDPGGNRARSRRIRRPPLRPDLEAHRRLADARRAPQEPDGNLRLRPGGREPGRTHGARTRGALRRVLAGVRRGRGRAGVE